jgi:hypothetical protein
VSDPLCDSLLDNYQKACTLMAETVGQFDRAQWVTGIASFQVPWKIAYHVVDCLDYYFREVDGGDYEWGHRFGGGWWELPDERQPSPDAVLAYLREVEGRIERHLRGLADADLTAPYDPEREHGETRLGHYLYGLRHTMHHHGALSLLSLQRGNSESGWA